MFSPRDGVKATSAEAKIMDFTCKNKAKDLLTMKTWRAILLFMS